MIWRVMDIELSNLIHLVQECWGRAEAQTIDLVATKYPGPREDFITYIFAGELRTLLATESEKGNIAETFLADLRQLFPHTSSFSLAGHSRGLIARVTFHNQSHEGKISAADFGVVVVRPVVRREFGGNVVHIHRDHATGLLAQAKLGRTTNSKRLRWNQLTKPQSRMYEHYRDFYSLLLYRLSGNDMDKLQAFRWQLCSDYALKEIKQWFSLGKFPRELQSSEILKRLFKGEIGTDDPKIIDSVIDSERTRSGSISIHIFWPSGWGPPSSISVSERLSQPIQQRIRH
jgi:hypothetical protein